MLRAVPILILLVLSALTTLAEDGYKLWLRYSPVQEKSLYAAYAALTSAIQLTGTSPTIQIAKNELTAGLLGMLGKKPVFTDQGTSYTLLAGTPASSPAIQHLSLEKQLKEAGKEGFIITSFKKSRQPVIVIAAQNDIGVLYGIFHFLRLMQCKTSFQNFALISKPAIKYRLLNHWDNLNRHVERGYAGISIFDWHRLPGYIDKRYTDYARANASVGLNGTVLTNVNASAEVLTAPYLLKVAALADVFRPYGIKVYLTARFSAPIEIGKLKTADPLNKEVQQWWKDKADEIYAHVPDFGGFLVKANSEGQPGPQNYNRNHADGANMLADALAPHGGIVMWRAFVYSSETPEDRFKQAYSEFKPLDGLFRRNVMIQVKNGPIDFQPREPFSPLFGAMPKTSLMMEFQLTQEYLGQGTNLVYEAPMFKEVLNTDTYRPEKGSTVGRVIDGSISSTENTGMAGVANIGNDANWTGHLFGQANWYTLGRLAWDKNITAEEIATEWIRQTFDCPPAIANKIKTIMMGSHETMVNYMTPLGLHHIMGTGHHYGPAPWVDNLGRHDWNPVYYHRADSTGLGFDRTAGGSNALAQYAPEIGALYGNIKTCPEKYLLWFHHVPWTYKLNSGRTLWDELCYRYYSGADSVTTMRKTWQSLQPFIDKERYHQVDMLLAIQQKEAVWWRNACLLYFQTFSKMDIPAQYQQPDHTLEYYRSLHFPYAPGNGQ